MLPQQRKGWTTVVDLEEFRAMKWAYLANVKMAWRYDGMAYLFRKAGIPLYGKDCGTMKMNHPFITLAVPQSRDKNYGIDIYVPASLKAKAEKLIADDDRLRECAELEALEGEAAYERFEAAAREAKTRNAVAKKARLADRANALVSAVAPRLASKNQ